MLVIMMTKVMKNISFRDGQEMRLYICFEMTKGLLRINISRIRFEGEGSVFSIIVTMS